MTPRLFRERRRTDVLWHTRVKEQYQTLPDTEECGEAAGQSESMLETGTCAAVGTVSTSAGPHAFP